MPLTPLAFIRTLQRRSNSRGQMAVIFIVFLTIIVVLAASTMNLGEIARLKTATAIAADAGALAGASMIASGLNEATLIAEGMWRVMQFFQLFFYVPFCWSAIRQYVPDALYALCYLICSWLRGVADQAMKGAWKLGKGTALVIAINNLSIDDRTNNAQQRATAFENNIDQLNKDTSTGAAPIPDSFTVDWDRIGSDGVALPSIVTVEVQYPPDSATPTLLQAKWNPFGIGLFRCIPLIIFNCCWPGAGWTGWRVPKFQPPQAPTGKDLGRPGYWLGAAWGVVIQTLRNFVPPLTFGFCSFCFPFPISWILPNWEVKPDRILNGNGTVSVRIVQSRSGGGELRGNGMVPFWTMWYPAEIESTATARYTSPKVTSWPDPNSTPELTVIR